MADLLTSSIWCGTFLTVDTVHVCNLTTLKCLGCSFIEKLSCGCCCRCGKTRCGYCYPWRSDWALHQQREEVGEHGAVGTMLPTFICYSPQSTVQPLTSAVQTYKPSLNRIFLWVTLSHSLTVVQHATNDGTFRKERPSLKHLSLKSMHFLH